MEQVLPHVDTMLHDHKLTIPERHKKWTGVSNKRILENFKKAYETFPDIDFIARTPLIPGVNADEEHIRAVLAFIRPAQERDRLRAAAVPPLRPRQVPEPGRECMSWTTTRRLPTTWSSTSSPSSTRRSGAVAKSREV